MNLITSLTKFSTIRELNLVETGIDFEDCKALRELLATSKYIKVLDIGCNYLSPGSIQLIVDGLSCNASLEKLDMSYTTLRSDHEAAFASMLKRNPFIKTLVLRFCSVSCESTLTLIESLKHNTTLEKLWLSPEYVPSSFHTLHKELQNRVIFQ